MQHDPLWLSFSDRLLSSSAPCFQIFFVFLPVRKPVRHHHLCTRVNKMGFSTSSTNIRLEGSTLVCNAKDTAGRDQETRLDLNRHIGNSDGWFTWEGQNFANSARNINLNPKGDGFWLEADLPKRDGGYRERQGIRLDERIENQNGSLVFRA
ncbi:CVNH domain-containing protein [Aspergillus bertholletiae]|uniref:CVNH domain-containing protein n=1 Tax=Aspergillus bertholletiae TaxID=1226010 RepID=A0A5N7AWL0_9EURO|nr:CVNH domain-containing protein [Aspergillus bertholletiae]